MPRLPETPARLAAALLDWYQRAKRDLPWRGSRDPYAIWVSEVMLQQTQVQTVLGYYVRFLRDFPTIEALAAAELPAVLARWSGLGYYARARSMHAAAKAVVARGGFPRSIEGLRELPGFGPYTAAAVGSIAFGLPEPAIDGNAVRVYARLTGLSAPRAAAEKLLREAARPLLAAAPPSELNQAVMELGATLCAPASPACLLCPWSAPCRARALGLQEAIPPPRERPARRPMTLAAAVWRDARGRLLFARRPPRGLFGGLWELPAVEVSAARDGGDIAEALAGWLRDGLGARVAVGERLGEVSQQLTHRDLRVVAFAATGHGRARAPASPRGYVEARFVAAADLTDLGLSSVTRKLLALPAVKGERPSTGAVQAIVPSR